MSAQASFPRLWEKDRISPPSADRHTQPSRHGFPEVAVSPFGRLARGTKQKESRRPPPPPARFLLFADSQTALWLRGAIKRKDVELFFRLETPGQGKHSGLWGGFVPWPEPVARLNTATCHLHFRSGQVQQGHLREAHRRQAALGLECMVAPCQEHPHLGPRELLRPHNG